MLSREAGGAETRIKHFLQEPEDPLTKIALLMPALLVTKSSALGQSSRRGTTSGAVDARCEVKKRVILALICPRLVGRLVC